MTKVTGVICEDCGQIIFSRARHDFRYCCCGNTSVDGGFDYLKIGANKPPKFVDFEVKATKKELYDDWNYSRDQY